MYNFPFEFSPEAPAKSRFTAQNVRFTVLTSRLIRIEYQKTGIYCDDATQCVINRNFDDAEFSYSISPGFVFIKTGDIELCYSMQDKKVESIKLRGGKRVTDFYKGTLPGTRRTLDMVYGRASLGDGIISENGVAVLDDSDTLLLTPENEIVPRKHKTDDKYYFAYGSDYKAALFDYFRLTGFPPLIPRFALGNWWSRYKAYTQQEYITLMERFKKENVPISVATVDMDWHPVDVVSRYGRKAVSFNLRSPMMLFYDIMSPGWTGYSWNTELFPDPKGFLNYLKKEGYRVTLNIHPSAGCKFYEDNYESFCRYMGKKADGKPITFDIADKKFREGYFKYLHRPHEENGVDFWWIDWQQGRRTAVKGLDPLWALNHYHYLESCKNGKRGLILSRFAGAGSHRYPLGFSGDTMQNFATLDFQPYFTSTAANIGYTWWSHDIGGHHLGSRDDELYLRWVQLGVFSPINRLHSTSDEFMGKEPWKYRGDVKNIAEDALRLRHKLIPYIYSMAYRTSTEGRALCEPMYYSYPDDNAYKTAPNEFMFGSELLVCPVTEKINPVLGSAGTNCVLPDGRFTDIFTGKVYKGGTALRMFRDETSIPVLAKEGAIIPMSGDSGNGCANPGNLEILAYRGNGTFTLYEDDGESTGYKNGDYTTTELKITENADDVTFYIGAARKCDGFDRFMPESRNITVKFSDVASCRQVRVTKGGKFTKFDMTEDGGCVTVTIENIDYTANYKIDLCGITARTSGSKRENLIELFSKLNMNNTAKSVKYTGFVLNGKPIRLHGDLAEAVNEIENMYYKK